MNFQKSISKGLEGFFDEMIESKRNFYQNNPECKPSPYTVKELASGVSDECAVKCSIIKGAFADKESTEALTEVIKSISEMVYDIGVAHGKDDKNGRDAVLHVLLSSFSRAGCPELNLPDLVVINPVPDGVLKKTIEKISAYFAQSLVKSVIVNWSPKVGSVLLTGWVKYIVSRVSNRANDFYSKDFDISAASSDFFSDKAGNSAKDAELETFRIALLMNLMKCDGEIAPEEAEYVELMIKNSILSDDEKSELLKKALKSEREEIDYERLKEIAEDPILMFLDLYALAKRDGIIHEKEKEFLDITGQKLGISDKVMLYF